MKITVKYIPSTEFAVFRKSIFGGMKLQDWDPDWLRSVQQWAEAVRRGRNHK